MIEEEKCPKCGKKEKVKNGFMKGKQRYKCKCYGIAKSEQMERNRDAKIRKQN